MVCLFPILPCLGIGLAKASHALPPCSEACVAILCTFHGVTRTDEGGRGGSYRELVQVGGCAV